MRSPLALAPTPVKPAVDTEQLAFPRISHNSNAIRRGEAMILKNNSIEVWALSRLVPALAVLLVAGCATTSTPQQVVSAPATAAQQAEAQRQAAVVVVKTLKRKVAIGRFTNETRYGKTFLVDANQDPLGKQATDMLSTRLVQTQKFLVFERPDLNKIQAEQIKLKESNLVGVDALIVGSITEFGR